MSGSNNMQTSSEPTPNVAELRPMEPLAQPKTLNGSSHSEEASGPTDTLPQGLMEEYLTEMENRRDQLAAEIRSAQALLDQTEQQLETMKNARTTLAQWHGTKNTASS